MESALNIDRIQGAGSCARCGHDNDARARFCRECGAPLHERCPRCGADVPADAKYCSECGGERQSRSAPVAVAASGRAERRHLSVVFFDVVGSTPISEQLDAEEFRDVLRAFQTAVGEAVRMHEGSIAQYVGDGVVAFFGAPHAQEDAACRAVRAALALDERLAVANATLERRHALRLHVRVAVHSGFVVLGEIGEAAAPDHGAVGETMHVAARLCDRTPPDRILVSEATHRLLDGSFDTEPVGSLELRGLSRPVAAYRVVAAREIEHGSFEPRSGRRLTPFVDREAEMALLVERWEAAKAGAGQVILLGGEPGIGKSRLVQAFEQRIGDEDHLVFGTECSPYHRTSTLYPIIQILERSLAFRAGDGPGERLAKLERMLGPLVTEVPDGVPLLAALLSIDPGDRHPLATMTPQRQRSQTLELLLSLMASTARVKPVLIVIDDLHWADPSTLGFLDTLVEQTASARLLTIFAHRPEFAPQWRPHAHLTRVTLGPIQRSRVESVVRGAVEPGALPPEIVAAVARRSEGNPLFAEELAHWMLEAGDATTGSVESERGIPPVLRDSLAARLDHLGPAKLIAQIAATIGRTFSYKVLRAVVPVEESPLRDALDRLTAAELVYRRGLPPRATYTFKHALIQEAAYESLLRSDRRRYHSAVARALEDGCPETIETQPELVAAHYSEAAQPVAAIGLWLRAAERAVARSANAEAVAHLRRALELVPDIEDPAMRGPHELAILGALAMPLALQLGYAAPEVDHVFVRARALAEELGNTQYLFGIVRGMLGFCEVGAQYARAGELAEELARLADLAGDPVWAIEAAWERGSVALFTGRLADARAHLARAIDLYDPDVHHANAYLFGEDPGVMAHVHASLACWLMGDADTAVRHAESGIELAQRIDHPNSLTMALCIAAGVHQGCGDVARCRARADEALRVATDQQFPHWIAMATVYSGWVTARSGEHAEGIARMRDGIAQWEATGAREAVPAMLAFVVEALLLDGRSAEAVATAEHALTLARASGERFYEPEIHRLLGEARRQEGAPDRDVEATFVRGLDCARACGARTLELRLASSLGRLWAGQGRHEAARALVADTCAGMLEGWDTADLCDARTFLEESR
jgi:class 3 adenylate cyclase/predicted ATPase